MQALTLASLTRLSRLSLYLVRRTDPVDYDEYDCFVVCCESADMARHTQPEKRYVSDCWTRDPSTLEVQLLGIAAPATPRGIVCASFNAG
jgi:hypothetical protein